MQNRQIGFNWAQNLFQIQEAMNNHPKEVLGYRTPAEVYGNRGNTALCEEVKVRSLRQKEEKRVAPSVYRKGENVLIRCPPTGGRRVVPRRRYTCKGVIVERQLSRNLYKVKFHRPDGKQDIQWFSVVNVTGITVSKEKKASKRNLKEEIKKDQHRNKYSIPLTCRDQIQRLRGAGVNILFDPFQSTGSCQFESAAHQLSLFGIHRTAGCLRQQAVEHIRQNASMYNDFIEGQLSNYVNEMKKDSTYGDHVTLLALSRLYNVQFLIVSADGPEYSVFISSDGSYSQQTFLLTLGYFPEGSGEHYMSIAIDSS